MKMLPTTSREFAMSSHPDADAFLRAILANPAELTTRLVFADWLEETGEPSNVAWARFIRLSTEVASLPVDSVSRRDLAQQLFELAPQVRATLIVDAKQLAGHVDLWLPLPKANILDHFWQLLPKANITVQLAGYALTQTVIEFMPESVARENLVLSLHIDGDRLFVATAEPANFDTIQKLQFIRNKDIVPVRADANEIRAAIEHCYGQCETESVTSIHYEAPMVGLEGDCVSTAIGGVFITAFSQHEYGRTCDGFEVRRTADRLCVVFLDGSNALLNIYFDRDLFTRLLDHLHSLPVDATYIANGLQCRRFDIPLLSGRRFPATLERPAEGEVSWYRVRFRWSDRE
jgi:uncharacterized protein (TIGR02996 family)